MPSVTTQGFTGNFNNGPTGQLLEYMLKDPAGPGSILGAAEKFIIDVAKIFDSDARKSGQKLDNVG